MFGNRVAGSYAESQLKQLYKYVDADLRVQKLSYAQKELAEKELDSGLPFTKCSNFKAALFVSELRSYRKLIDGIRSELTRLGHSPESAEREYRKQQSSTATDVLKIC